MNNLETDIRNYVKKPVSNSLKEAFLTTRNDISYQLTLQFCELFNEHNIHEPSKIDIYRIPVARGYLFQFSWQLLEKEIWVKIFKSDNGILFDVSIFCEPKSIYKDLSSEQAFEILLPHIEK